MCVLVFFLFLFFILDESALIRRKLRIVTRNSVHYSIQPISATSDDRGFSLFLAAGPEKDKRR